MRETNSTRPLARVGGMPKVAGGLVLGALPELLRDQFKALRRWQQDYGGVFEVNIGAMSFVVAADANTASEMMIERHRAFARGGALYEPVQRLLGQQSLLTSEGDHWRGRRRAAQPHFRQQAVAMMTERISRTLTEVLDTLQPGPCDIDEVTGRISMAVALRVMFSESSKEARFETLAHALDDAIARIAFGWVSARLPRWLPLPGRARYRRSLATIDETVEWLVERRRASGEFGDDFLGMLLHMAEGGDMTTQDIRDEAVTLIVAGYETIATAMAWAFYELACHPEILARAQAEADAFARGELAEVTDLRFTTQVFKEALRKYPSTIWLPRNAAEDSELAGYPVKAGTAVLCSPYLVHHDPHAWDEPERFDPERFAEGSAQPRNRFAFMPFGLGPHMCVGLHLAMLEGPLAIARLLQRWTLAPIPGREPSPKISTTMSNKDGIWLELSARTP
ncbi:MAG: cytochrome P450 [Enhygromyxa sp.]